MGPIILHLLFFLFFFISFRNTHSEFAYLNSHSSCTASHHWHHHHIPLLSPHNKVVFFLSLSLYLSPCFFFFLSCLLLISRMRHGSFFPCLTVWFNYRISNGHFFILICGPSNVFFVFWFLNLVTESERVSLG